MNYEELYQKLQVLEKGMNDRIRSSQKNFKKGALYSEKGDIKNYAKTITAMQACVTEQLALLNEMQLLAEGFDAYEYMKNGDFAEQLEYECKQLSVDVKGEFPNYEMFPYKVRIDTEACDIYVDRKKWQCLRPVSFARDIKANQERLMKAPFNAAVFANELCAAYDTAIAMKNNRDIAASPDANISLRDIYMYLAPMQRHRKDYDIQSYSYDLARLYISSLQQVKDGRNFQFGMSRASKRQIRILDANGQEQFLATIRFWRGDEQDALQESL